MRELEFRGITKDTNEWVYGCLITLPFGKSYILYGNYDNKVEVNKETVGQFTGLLDKNGKKIFEGDVVSLPYVTPFGDIIDENYACCAITFDKGSFVLETDGQKNNIPVRDWCQKIKGEYIPNYGNPEVLKEITYLEVIGNIHQNKELIKEQTNER